MHRILKSLALAFVAAPSLFAQSAKRPMTFLDVQDMKSAAAPAVSADGKMMLYILLCAYKNYLLRKCLI